MAKTVKSVDRIGVKNPSEKKSVRIWPKSLVKAIGEHSLQRR